MEKDEKSEFGIFSLSGAEKYKDAASELLTFESCRKKVPTNLGKNFARNTANLDVAH